MRDPLENVTIGNFLYGLGLGIGARAGSRAPAGCINLLQQTPLDGPLGDVMLQYPGIFRLIEFKRRSADKYKEQAKHAVLESALKSREDLRRISRDVHWYVETNDGNRAFHVTVKRYLDMWDDEVAFSGLEKFVADLVDRALDPKPSCSPARVAQYLEAVAIFAGKPDAASSGMLVSVGSDGAMRYVVVENIRDVRLTRTQLLEREFERQQSVARQRAKTLARLPRQLGRSL